MKKIEHIGIAVKSLSEANATYTALLGIPPYKQESVSGESVNTSFYQVGQTKIELLESSSDVGPIAKYIQKRGEGIHHIAFDVEDIISERERLIRQGFEAIGEIKPGADNKLVCFFHPKSSHGVLIELCQNRP